MVPAPRLLVPSLGLALRVRLGQEKGAGANWQALSAQTEGSYPAISGILFVLKSLKPVTNPSHFI